jgi:formylglycine-generating enzyme required for sulfatase activity
MLLDACRSQGRRRGLGLGTEEQQGMVTVYSCSPRESSYEVEKLGHGSFTYALLEGFALQGSSSCATVERLDQHLSYRVPDLNASHGKPNQTPYTAVFPLSKKHLILLPRNARLEDVQALKHEAQKAELTRKFTLAKQYWVRVLAASPADSEAIAGIERLSRVSITQVSPLQPVANLPEPLTDGSEGLSVEKLPEPAQAELVEAKVPDPSTSPRAPLSRRRTIQILGFAGVGLGAALFGRGLLQSLSDTNGDNNNDTGVPPAPEPTPGKGDEVITLKSPEESSPTTPLTSADFTPFEFEMVTVNEVGAVTNQTRKSVYAFRDMVGDMALEMVAIPGGSLTMGSPVGEKGRRIDEGPQREVQVAPFLMGKYPVTQAQWKAIAALPKVEIDLDSDPAKFEGDNLPVDQVSWNHAMEFCHRLSQVSGREYRLPSEAEWEYACRAGTTTPFHFGPTIISDLANYRGDLVYGAEPKGSFRETTTDVGSFPANAYGLYDVHGNVWEWCLDGWHDSYDNAPLDGSAWTEGGEAAIRVLRGGSWKNDPGWCRSAVRTRHSRNHFYDYSGFRVVCTIPWTL